MKNRDNEKHFNLRIPKKLHQKMESCINTRYLKCSKNNFILVALDWYIEMEISMRPTQKIIVETQEIGLG